MSIFNRTVFASSGRAVLLLGAILISLAFLAAPCWAQQFETDKLLASDGGAFDGFGNSISLSGDWALVGAWCDDVNEWNSGSAYVFAYDSVSGMWHEEAKLVASDGADGAFLGCSSALFGIRALIGAYGDDDNGDESGSAYLFVHDSVSGTWQEEAKLLASDGAYGDNFGYSVVLHGDRALVGAAGDDTERGSVYVFGYDSVSGTWQEEAKLIASDGAPYDRFGCSVALYEERVLIGSRYDDDNGSLSGSAYVLRYDSLNGTWHEEAKLVASDGDAEDRFGGSVALFGDRALIGVYGDDDNGYSSGSAYLFVYDSVSGSWHEEAKLTASDGVDDDRFGYSVALRGTRALIGARNDDDNGGDSGSAYLFEYDSGSGTWHEEAKLLASDGWHWAGLGCSVALSGDNALVGAPGYTGETGQGTGAAYVYDFTSTLALDAKCNGEDQNVIVNSGENVTLTIDIDNGYHPNLEGDLWVVAILPIPGWNTWTYGPWMNPFWRLGAGNVYYTGPPLNHAATVCDQPLPPGSYKLCLAVDAVPNGVLDLTALWDFDVVDFTVQ